MSSNSVKSEIRKGLSALNVALPFRAYKAPDKTPLRSPKSAPSLTRSQTHANERQAKTTKAHAIAVPSENDGLVIDTGSKLNPVQIEPPLLTIKIANEIDSNGSEFDPVKIKQGSKLTGSNINPVNESRSRAQIPRGFTQVPNMLLRMDSPFTDPIDFLIYLHLFTYSHGFGRSTAQMGIIQLQRFTQAARNTVRKSVERLASQGWIEMVEDFESGRVSRRWRVSTPQEMVERFEPTGLNLNPVKIEPGQNLTPMGLKIDPVTGFKFDTNKERNKEPSNTHTQAASQSECATVKTENETQSPNEGDDKLTKYLQSISVIRKRQREQQALQELKQAGFECNQIEKCLLWLSTNGVPSSGEPCHSPLQFLATGAITQVIELASLAALKRQASERLKQSETEKQQQERAECEADERLASEREQKFIRAYPSEDSQAKFVAEFRTRHPEMAVLSGVGLRRLAILEWATLIQIDQATSQLQLAT